jgi:tRNA G18 (ribose-2'-O)-methylase SpoU
MTDAHRDTPVVAAGPLVWVQDVNDPVLDLYRELNDPALRVQLEADQAVFVVEGRLAVQRLLTSDYSVRSLLVDDHQVTLAGELVAATRAQGAPVFVGSRALVADTVGFALHRGVVALANRPAPEGSERLLARVAEKPALGGSLPLVAVLEGLNDHENIGALFRNAAAFGVAGVFLSPTCADPLYRRSIRVSVGYVLHVPFARLTPWPGGIHDLRAAGFVVAALSPHPTAENDAPIIGPGELKAWIAEHAHRPLGAALLFGAEGRGLTDAASAASDVMVSIPMASGVDSLNVATAAAVALHALAGL